MIRITETIAIDERDIEERFVLSSGPGGQNVNKVATAVQLRVDIACIRGLRDDLRARLARLAGRRLTVDGILVIEAKRTRSQERNRADALERLVALLRRAAEPPRPRRPTKPSRTARAKRVDTKKRRSVVKQRRGVPKDED
jgi:ribosome-associated protein